jgi:hypothetical protein
MPASTAVPLVEPGTADDEQQPGSDGDHQAAAEGVCALWLSCVFAGRRWCLGCCTV